MWTDQTVDNEREPFSNTDQCCDTSASTLTCSAQAQQSTWGWRKDSHKAGLGRQIYCWGSSSVRQGPSNIAKLPEPGRSSLHEKLKPKDAHSRIIMPYKCSAFGFFVFFFFPLNCVIFLSISDIFFLVLGFRHLANSLEFKLNSVYKVLPIL